MKQISLSVAAVKNTRGSKTGGGAERAKKSLLGQVAVMGVEMGKQCF